MYWNVSRIDIESPGILLPGMTIEDMKNGVSRIRNPVIARVFRELGVVEQWGSCVKRIFAEARQQKLPEPIITEIATGIRFTIRLREPVGVAGPAGMSENLPKPPYQLLMLRILSHKIFCVSQLKQIKFKTRGNRAPHQGVAFGV